MTTLLIAQNETRESGSFMGDQLCSLRTAYLFAEHAPPGTDHFVMSVSPGNEMHFLWTKFIERYAIELVHDDWNPGDWPARWTAWDRWRAERRIRRDDESYIEFDHYRELYLRIHGAQRQRLLCGSERGLGRRNIYQYWWCGQEGAPDELPRSVDWFDDTLVHHPPRCPTRDVYISPHAKTQGNATFTFDFWAEVVNHLVDAGVSVTVGYDGYFCPDLGDHPLYRRHWGTHEEWAAQLCAHKLVACGNTGTGWLAAACGVPMITMEPPNSQMPDHRYRECGLRNIVEMVDVPDPEYVARRIVEVVRKCVVMTTGCYDVLHAGHVRHLEKCRAMGTRLVVALNSDSSVRALKGPDRPINPQNRRRAVLEALRCVDEVRVFDGPDARGLIAEVRPDVLACGFGYTPDTIVGRDLVESWGGRTVVTCSAAAEDEPSTTKIVQRVRAADVVEVCRLAAGYSVNPFDKLRLLADHLLSVRHLPGDVADLGAMRGGTSLVMRRLVPDKHLHLFDTWEGTPYDDPLCHHGKGSWESGLEDCRRLVGNGEIIHYHQGVFPRTAEEADSGWFCFVYVDMDTYQATKDAIDFFWPRLVVGGKLCLDDWAWIPCAGVEKAIRESFSEDQFTTVINTCIIEKKQ